MQPPEANELVPGSKRRAFAEGAWTAAWRRYHREHVRQMRAVCTPCAKEAKAAAAAAAEGQGGVLATGDDLSGLFPPAASRSAA